MAHQVWNQEASEYTGRLVRPSARKVPARQIVVSRGVNGELGVEPGADIGRESTAEDRQRALRATVEPEPLHDRR